MSEFSIRGKKSPDEQHIGPVNPLVKFEISSPETIEKALAVEDLTQDGSTHAINLVREAVQNTLAKRNFPNIQVVRGSAVVPLHDNFDRLLFPDNNIGRSSTYTRYVDEDHVLKTHTSALVPGTLDEVKAGKYEDDTTFVFPGLVYRRDVTDRTHLGVFHQMDVWRVKKNNGEEPMNVQDLGRLVLAVFEAATPGSEPIVYQADHPYTVEGVEVYAKFGDDELEVLEAGLIHPDVLAGSGLSPDEYSGLALGMGLDRLVMARKGMPDIRMLRAQNPRIASQMHDLRPFEQVSDQPDMSRDISYVVSSDVTPEDIAESVREAFGDDAYLIEEVQIKSATHPGDLHPNAVKRLGIREGQQNVLVNINLRHPDRTLTKKEINALYREAYPKIHQGSEPGYI